MTDVSISDIRPISHKDLEKKINQLDVYIKRVVQRISALHNVSKNSTKPQSLVNEKFNKYGSNIKVHR